MDMLVPSHLLLFFLGFSIAFILMLMYVLIRERHYLAKLLDYTIEGVVLSHKGVIIKCNQQALTLLGVDKESDIIGKELLSFVAPESVDAIKSNLSQDAKPYECRLMRLDGSTFSALVRGAMIDKNIRLSAVIDISELKKAQYALQALNENLELQVKEHVQTNHQQEAMLFQQSRHAQMGEMISMIAHQWRQPLNVLSLLAQNIAFKYRQHKLDDKTMETFKSDSMRQILQMSKTIDDFRDFFKPEKSKKVFDLKTQLEYTIEMVKPILTSHGIEVECRYIDDIKIESFPNEFGQSIISILNNAKDVLIDKSELLLKKITLRVTLLEPDKVSIAIEDNGGGILEEHLSKVFQPYFSTKSEKNGTGLGLYMTKLIIEEHMKGTISVTNIREGALFEIVLQRLIP